jgi:hypothetical protein
MAIPVLPLNPETATTKMSVKRSRIEKQIAGDFRLGYHRPLAEKVAQAEMEIPPIKLGEIQ